MTAGSQPTLVATCFKIAAFLEENQATTSESAYDSNLSNLIESLVTDTDLSDATIANSAAVAIATIEADPVNLCNLVWKLLEAGLKRLNSQFIEFVLLVLYHFRIGRRFSLLCRMCENHTPFLLSELLSSLDQVEKVNLLLPLCEDLMFGYQLSPKLIVDNMNCLKHIVEANRNIQNSQVADFVQNLLLLSKRFLKVEFDEECVIKMDEKKMNRLLRKNSWIVNGMNDPKFLLNNYIMPWGSGCWELEGRSGQGMDPTLLLGPVDCGIACHIKGKCVDKSKTKYMISGLLSHWKAHSIFDFQGCLESPNASPKLGKAPIKLNIIAGNHGNVRFHGIRSRTNDRHGVLGVKFKPRNFYNLLHVFHDDNLRLDADGYLTACPFLFYLQERPLFDYDCDTRNSAVKWNMYIDSGFTITQSSFTLEAWAAVCIEEHVARSEMTIFANHLFCLSCVANPSEPDCLLVRLYFYDQVGPIEFNENLKIHEYIHYCLIVHYGSIRLLINGKQVLSRDIDGSKVNINPSSTLVIGTNAELTNCFYGYLGEVRLFACVKSHEEVMGSMKQALFTESRDQSSSLLLYLPLLFTDSASLVNTLRDYSGNGHHSVLRYVQNKPVDSGACYPVFGEQQSLKFNWCLSLPHNDSEPDPTSATRENNKHPNKKAKMCGATSVAPYPVSGHFVDFLIKHDNISGSDQIRLAGRGCRVDRMYNGIFLGFAGGFSEVLFHDPVNVVSGFDCCLSLATTCDASKISLCLQNASYFDLYSHESGKQTTNETQQMLSKCSSINDLTARLNIDDKEVDESATVVGGSLFVEIDIIGFGEVENIKMAKMHVSIHAISDASRKKQCLFAANNIMAPIGHGNSESPNVRDYILRITKTGYPNEFLQVSTEFEDKMIPLVQTKINLIDVLKLTHDGVYFSVFTNGGSVDDAAIPNEGLQLKQFQVRGINGDQYIHSAQPEEVKAVTSSSKSNAGGSGMFKALTNLAETAGSESDVWVCGSCTVRNEKHLNVCHVCHNKRPGTSPLMEPLSFVADWTCTACTMSNPAGTTKCDTCGTVKPDSDVPMASVVSTPDPVMTQSTISQSNEENHWSCPACTYINQKTSETCELCTTGQRPNNTHSDIVIIGDVVDDTEMIDLVNQASVITPADQSKEYDAAIDKYQSYRVDQLIKSLDYLSNQESFRLDKNDSFYDLFCCKWDTTLGITNFSKAKQSIDAPASSAAEDLLSQDKENIPMPSLPGTESDSGLFPVYCMEGTYGNMSDSVLHQLTWFDKNKSCWRAFGFWLQNSGMDDSLRTGSHFYEYKLNRSGDKFSGKWYHGISSSGEWDARLLRDVSFFRGIDMDSEKYKTQLVNQTIVPVSNAFDDSVTVSVLNDVIDLDKVSNPYYTGLVNMEQGLTNICYQNSLLQALYMSDHFMKDVVQCQFDTNDSMEVDTNRAVTTFTHLQKVFTKLLLSEQKKFATKLFQQTLPYEWTAGRQMDVADFSTYLMSNCETALKHMNLNDICAANFGCVSSQVLQCTNCDNVKLSKESELGLALPLPNLFTPIIKISAVVIDKKAPREEDVSLFGDYEKIPQNLNKDKQKAPLTFLCVQRLPQQSVAVDDSEPPLTAITLVTARSSEPKPRAPQDFTLLDINLNQHTVNNNQTQDDQVYLCYKREKGGSPITDIKVVYGDNDDDIPGGYKVLNVNVNPGCTGPQSFAGAVTGPAEIDLVSNASLLQSSSNSAFTASALQAAKGSTAAPSKPTTVRLCYRLGMPITDVALGHKSPNNGRNYNFIDVPLTAAVDGTLGGDDVYLYVSDCSSVTPITRLFFLNQEDVDDYIEQHPLVERCAHKLDLTFPPVPGSQSRRCLMKQRGDGCPLTQINIFKAPNVRPPYRYNEVLELLPPAAGSDLIYRALDKAKFFPKQPLPTPIIHEGLMLPRGARLSFNIKTETPEVECHIAEGTWINTDEKQHGFIKGVVIKEHGVWSFSGRYCALSTLFNESVDKANWDCINMKFSMDSFTASILVEGDYSSTTGTVPMQKSVSGNLKARRVKQSLPIVDVTVLRAEEPLPDGYEYLTDLNGQQVNLLHYSDHSSFIAFRRALPSVDAQPLTDIGLYMPELESLNSDYQAVMHNVYNASADLRYGSNASPLFLVIKRHKGGEISATDNLLYDLKLVYEDRNETVPTNYKALKMTHQHTAPTNLCLNEIHRLYLCKRLQVKVRGVVDQAINGVYNTTFGELSIHGVSAMMRGYQVGGKFTAVATHGQGKEQIMGVLLPAAESDIYDAVPSSKKADDYSFMLHGVWFNCLSNYCPSPCWVLFDAAHRNVTVEWNWARLKGKVEFVKDDYLELGIIQDFSEYWVNNQQKYSDRCNSNNVQNIVQHYFSSAILSGSNKPRCDSAKCASSKQTHKQFTVMLQPPKHLMLTIKRMGFDFAKNQASKLIENTKFHPVLALPAITEDLRCHLKEAEERESDSRVYGLYGVIIHTGKNASSGHYYTYARHSSTCDLYERDSRYSPWILFNDANVSCVKWLDILRDIENNESITPYVLLYRKLTAVEIQTFHNRGEMDTSTAASSCNDTAVSQLLRQFATLNADSWFSEMANENAKFLFERFERQTNKDYRRQLQLYFLEKYL